MTIELSNHGWLNYEGDWSWRSERSDGAVALILPSSQPRIRDQGEAASAKRAKGGCERGFQ